MQWVWCFWVPIWILWMVYPLLPHTLPPRSPSALGVSRQILFARRTSFSIWLLPFERLAYLLPRPHRDAFLLFFTARLWERLPALELKTKLKLLWEVSKSALCQVSLLVLTLNVVLLLPSIWRILWGSSRLFLVRFQGSIHVVVQMLPCICSSIDCK